MSSWQVTDKSINRLISFFATLDGKKFGYVTSPFGKTGQQSLARDMAKMNLDALESRYPDADHQATAIRFVEDNEWINKPFQAFKSLGCFLYQCSEGNVPEHALYKKLRELEGDLARGLISITSEYEAAIWE